MKNSILTKSILLFFFVTVCGVSYAQRIYLSGRDASDAIPWDFKISTGRNSGFWTTVPVPSNWELHGFGHYTYGRDYPEHKADPEIGYYKRKFVLRNIGDKRYRLTFQGSMTDTHVTINGKRAGAPHRGGFMQFSYEITPLIKEGENLIEVAVHKSSENENIQASERRTDFWLFGGIFRPVYIDVLPEEFIDRVAVDARMDGAFTMDVYLDNMHKADRLEARVYDDRGHPVGKPLQAKVNQGDSLLTLTRTFENIKRWSHEFPNLYSVEVKLFSGKKPIHDLVRKFGFRTFEVRDHDGFYLNGKRILLKGVAMHSIRPETGRTLSKEDILENFRLAKEMNCNTVRPCHYPPDEYFYNLCDSLGMLALCELTGWHHPLDKQNGSRLIKEMIVRDVNHPSIVLWSNGNHQSHNPALDEDFFKWDIQQRRPLKNAARVETWPGNYDPAFDIVDTRYYPTYQQLTERLSDSHIVFPNETLHALYDGGGAAGLYDYWEAFKASKVGGGLIIWAMFDEGVVRTDEANRLDVQGNKAPDGLLGPHGEKEEGFFTAREIWSPVQISVTDLSHDFGGLIPVKNEFTFTNLNQCEVEWQLIHFTSKNESQAGYRTISHGVATGDVPAGTAGSVAINLPENWRTGDALKVRVVDPQGNVVQEKTLMIADRKHLAGTFKSTPDVKIVRDQADPFCFHVGNTTFKFDRITGSLDEVKVNGEKLPVGRTPFLAVKPAGDSIVLDHGKGSVRISGSDVAYKIESKGNNAFRQFTWTLSADGTLTLEYAYALPHGKYDYAGIGMEVPSASVTGKRWLGKGPNRIWKNRTHGGMINVWDIEKQPSIPGEVWNYPAFEGFFDQWYWAIIRFEQGQNMGISLPDDQLKLGVLNPVNGKDPQLAIWHYPEKEGIYLFNAISPVGSKWTPAEAHGPASEATEMSGVITGTVQFNFGWNQSISDDPSRSVGVR